MTERVAVVILNYNDHEVTAACLGSVEGQALVAAIVVVDNGSEASDQDALRAALVDRPEVRLVLSPDNGGFGAGMNLGIERALSDGADAVLLLNNDTRLDPGAVKELVAALDADHAAGVAVPVITTGTGNEIWAAGGFVDANLRASHRHVGAAVGTTVTPPTEALTFAPGAALLVRTQALMDVGGFVEGYFLYCEDVELSLRLRDAGYGIVLAPRAVVWHAVQGGDQGRSTRSVYYRTRNTMWLARSRLRGGARVRADVFALLVGLRVVAEVSALRPRLVLAGLRQWLLGLRDGARHLPSGTDLTPHVFVS